VDPGILASRMLGPRYTPFIVRTGGPDTAAVPLSELVYCWITNKLSHAYEGKRQFLKIALKNYPIARITMP